MVLDELEMIVVQRDPDQREDTFNITHEMLIERTAARNVGGQMNILVPRIDEHPQAIREVPRREKRKNDAPGSAGCRRLRRRGAHGCLAWAESLVCVDSPVGVVSTRGGMLQNPSEPMPSGFAIRFK